MILFLNCIILTSCSVVTVLQYETCIKSFTEIHKEYVTTKESGFSTTDVKKDIASMEDEKEQLVKRIERLKRKVKSCGMSIFNISAPFCVFISRQRENSAHIATLNQ